MLKNKLWTLPDYVSGDSDDDEPPCSAKAPCKKRSWTRPDYVSDNSDDSDDDEPSPPAKAPKPTPAPPVVVVQTETAPVVVGTRVFPSPPEPEPVPKGSTKKKQYKYKSPMRYTDTDAFQHGDVGQVVAVEGDPDVVWRAVPGFPEDRVLACEDGRVWTMDMKGVEKTTTGSINKATQRAEIRIDGYKYYMYQLICRAFDGGCEGRTVDHGKNGVFDNGGDCTDNRACNLKWATKK
jgi:hypothetical protein